MFENRRPPYNNRSRILKKPGRTRSPCVTQSLDTLGLRTLELVQQTHLSQRFDRLKPLCQHPKHVRGRIPAIKACCVPQSQPLYVTGGYKFTRGYYVPPAFIQRSNWCWPHSKEVHRQNRLNPKSTTDFNRFPFNNFTYCLTLFPKCFSSFPLSLSTI